MAKADGLLPKFIHFQTHIKYTDDKNVEVQLEDVTDHDFVEVVRCADCKWSQYDELFHTYWCEGCRVDSDFFCANGKRKENDGRNSDEGNK